MPRNTHYSIPLVLDSQTVQALLASKATRLVFPGYKNQNPGRPAGGYPPNRPVGKSGDVLWVREAWNHANYPDGPYEAGTPLYYRADYLDDPWGADFEHSPDGMRRVWMPAARMPRAVCRITLRIREFKTIKSSCVRCLDAIANAHQLAQMPGVDGQQDLFDPDPLVWLVEFDTEIAGEAR